MNRQELKEHILKFMTAEEALDKFLQTSIEHYKALKTCTESEHEGNPLFIIIAAAEDMGWHIAIEDGPREAEIRGIVIGTREYLTDTVNLKTEENEQNNPDNGSSRDDREQPGASPIGNNRT